MTDCVPDAVQRLAASRDGQASLLPHHLETAHRLSALFERSRMRQRVTMSYDPARTGGRGGSPVQGELADSAADARQRLNRLARTVAGDCWGVLTDVCAFDKGLQQIETERMRPRRSAKLVLRIGLDQLCAQFGLQSHAQGQAHGRIDSWLEERPPMFPEPGN